MKFSSKILKEKVINAPENPGCYIFKDSLEKILYIGKAKNIRNRIKNYFQNFEKLDSKTRSLINCVNDVEFVLTDSELEALILESNLIKKYKPKYNISKKDDKGYAWIQIKEKEDFPIVRIVLQKENNKDFYFGPFDSAFHIKRIIKALRKIFPYRSCNRSIKLKKGKFYSSNTKPCLYHHINLCQAPCTGNVNQKEYKKSIRAIKLFLKSKKNELYKELKNEMNKLSGFRKFEKAAQIRDKINDLAYISQRINIDQTIDERIYLKQKQQRTDEALQKLFAILNIEIKNRDIRMECYDISNIQGKNATGSMVVFVNGKNVTKQYRKFKIKSKNTADDYSMLEEVLKRRVMYFRSDNKKDKSFNNKPDLIIVDGGKGQLNIAYRLMNKLKISIPVISLAKKNEEIFQIRESTGGELRAKKITLKKGSEIKFLMQRIRDESHRFAIKYHRTLRSVGQRKSVLDEIPGVGKISKQKLLSAFGSVDNIKKATKNELQQIVKNKATIEAIKKVLV